MTVLLILLLVISIIINVWQVLFRSNEKFAISKKRNGHPVEPDKPEEPEFEDYWAHRVAEEARSKILAYFGIITLLFSTLLTLYGISGIKNILENQFASLVAQKEKVASDRVKARLDAFEKRLTTEMETVKKKREEFDVFITSTAISPTARNTAVLLDSMIGPIRDQGAEGTTIGFSIAYAIQASIQKKWNEKVLVSARGIYQTAQKHDEWPGEDYEGTSLEGGIKGGRNIGIFLESDWPYQRRSIPNARPKFRISNSLRIADMEGIKRELDRGNVVVVSLLVSADFYESRDGHIVVKQTADQGHSIAIVGYNAGTKEFKFANMWGGQWGDKGFGYLKESDLSKLKSDAYVVEVEKTAS